MSYGYPAYQQPYHPQPYQAVRTSAPPSVHVVAVIQYLIGFVTLLAAVLLGTIAFGVLDIQTADLASQYREVMAGSMVVVVAVVGFDALCWLVVARKLQRGRQWARILTIVLSVLSIAGSVYQYATLPAVRGGDPLQAAGPFAVAVAVPVLFVLLLNTRAARSWFRRRTY